MMQTTLPDLPFSDYGKAELHTSGIHSSIKTTPRTHPRTDLQTFTPWTSFPEDIHQAIQSAAPNADNTPFEIEASKRTRIVKNEEGIRAHAIVTLHEPVEQVVKMLGVTGSFELSGGGNTAIVGSPDFSWIMDSKDQPHPKLIASVSSYYFMCISYCVLNICRLSTRLGGQPIWTFPEPGMHVIIIRASLTNNPWMLYNKYMDI